MDPANANRYAYAGGDPVNNFDPTGLYGIEGAIGDLIGFGVSALIAVPAAMLLAPAGIAMVAAIAASGCIGGVVSEAATNAIKNQESDLGSLALKCGVGIITAGRG